MTFQIALAIVLLAGVATFPLWAHIFEHENRNRRAKR